MVMLPHKGKKDALTVAGRIQKNIKKKKIVFEKEKIAVSASMGIVAIKTDKKMSISALIKIADEALYEAKAKGGDCFVVKII